ncbi:hypothetical protein [Winogradskyella sp.]|nr:hypothetical protein [Winogradskyella sp.]
MKQIYISGIAQLSYLNLEKWISDFLNESDAISRLVRMGSIQI